MLLIRLPDELKEWLKEQAAKEERTMTTIMIRALRAEKTRIEVKEAREAEGQQ
jgi:predicted transcriptional regulator